MSDSDVVVLDNGSKYLRAGFAGSAAPQLKTVNTESRADSGAGLPTPRLGAVRDTQGGGRAVYGEVGPQEASLQVSWPVRRGVVQDWQAEERVLAYALETELQVEAGDPLCVLMSSHAITRTQDKERMLQLMMERFQAHSFALESGAKLGCFGSGVATGLAVEVGFGHLLHAAAAIAVRPGASSE